MMYIIARTIYPYMNRHRDAFDAMRKYLLLPGLFISLSLILLAGVAVDLLFTERFDETKTVLRLLAFSPFMIGMMGAYGSNYLLVHKHDKLYMRIIMYSSLSGLLLLCGGILLYQHIGAAVTVVFTRTLIALLCFVTYRRLRGVPRQTEAA